MKVVQRNQSKQSYRQVISQPLFREEPQREEARNDEPKKVNVPLDQSLSNTATQIVRTFFEET